MLSGSLYKVTANLTTPLRRFYFPSCILCKKYKYQLYPKKNVARGTTLSQYSRPRRRGVTIVDGKALTYFQLDGYFIDDDSEDPDVESPKQRAYAEIVEAAVNSLLMSKDAPDEMQDFFIEIVHVEVTSTLTQATVVWKLPDYCETKYNKEETAAILERHLPQLQRLLPAHSTVTQTPTVEFLYDTISEKQKLMDETFDRIQLEETEFLSKNGLQEEEVS